MITMTEAIELKPGDHGYVTALARRIGVSREHLSVILAGKRIPGRRLAEKLEHVTGISAMVWLFPERGKNRVIQSIREKREAEEPV